MGTKGLRHRLQEGHIIPWSNILPNLPADFLVEVMGHATPSLPHHGSCGRMDHVLSTPDPAQLILEDVFKVPH